MSRSNRIVCFLILLAVAVGCGKGPQPATLGAAERFAQGMTAYEKKKYLQAIEHFQAVLYNYPGNAVIDTAQYYLALAYFGNDEYELAGVEFNRLLTNHPSSPFVSHAQYMKAVCAYEAAPKNPGLDQTEVTDAIRQLQDFIEDRPESEFVDDARQLLRQANTRLAKKYFKAGVVYTRINAPKSARIYYQKVVDDYTDSDYAPLAIYAIAESDFALRNYDSARVKFEGFIAAFPAHELAAKARESAARSWLKSGEQSLVKGDSLKARQSFEQLIKLYPDDKHAIKAGKLLPALPSDTTSAADRAQQTP